ncbi:MAG: MBL fold metallo-hydrolase [Lentisphaeria bacterium]|nr:MBL fold metallo-hydrolase [Lentisphaeria bacterium]
MNPFNKMQITLLVDGNAPPPLQSEFGLAMWVESRAGTWIFDTGAGEALRCNLAALGLEPEYADGVILSHGHRDHTGGLAQLHPRRIWCTPSVGIGHYSWHADGSVHELTLPEAARKRMAGSETMEINGWTEFAPGWFLTGSIPRNSGEDCGGDFFHDADCSVPDEIPDEMALLSADGVLISGCCHAGIINTLEWCRQMRPEIRIHTVLGGLHLRNASEERLRQTAEYLRHSALRRLLLLHCTGENAVSFLRNALPDCRIDVPQPGERLTL